MKRLTLGFLLASLAAVPAPAAEHAPAPAARAFEAFLAHSAPLCLREPARRCVDAGWRFADRDRDGGLSLTELESVRTALRSWLTWKNDEIAPQERRGIRLGLWIVEAIGLPRLVESYDGNGDGAISRGELLSDVRLDDRPLGAVLIDPDAVDWDSLKRRLGAMAPALGGVAPDTAE
ncbi:MAG: hypothetical protein ACE5GS_11390 [Kiloniellaceae bacterium]